MSTVPLARKTPALLCVIIVDVVLFLGVMALMNHVKYLLLEDVRLNLNEMASQAADVIDNRLDLETHVHTLLARNLAEHNGRHGKGPAHSPGSGDWQVGLAELTGREAGRYFIADSEGRVAMPGYEPFSVKGRTYFRKAMSEGANFSSRLIFRFNGEPGLVLSAPLIHRDKVMGTLQKFYTPAQFYTMAVPSVFASRGEINIISQQGYLLVSSDDTGQGGDFDNYFRDLYENGNREAVERMERDLGQYKAGFVEVFYGDEKRFAVYMPIDAVPGWSLVFSVAQSTVFQHATRVMRLFYGILLVLVLIFGLSMGMFLRMKRREQERLEEVAFVDSVTGGDTYGKFMLDLQQSLARRRDTIHSILSFDIDSFKYVNSHYGFEVGDELLRHVDRYIREQLDEGEALGHVAGDRFVALLRDANPVRVRDMLAPLETPHGVTLHFSGGLYAIKNPSESTKLMVDKATLASKEVKGKLNECLATYTRELDQRTLRAEQLKQELQLALEKGEIIPFFQPKVDIETGRLVGAEALARWRKPDGTLVPPGEFIPVSERTGLVVDIDKAIFTHVLGFIHENLQAGASGAPISTNFSRMHLLDARFPLNLLQTLRESGVPPRCLEVELTESAFYTSNKRMAELVATLRNAGVHVSMDDFGSGYSSLNMLKDVPINVLKIDQGFLQQTSDMARRDIIFATVVRMARELDIEVVVEGVERQEDVDLMRRFSCRVAQGYFYSKPLPPEVFAAVYQQGHL